LPLHFLSDLSPKEAFKFVTGEFKLNSYKAWIAAAKIFRFSADNIRVLTVQNTIQVCQSLTDNTIIQNRCQ
jgi:hypothetical protein